MEEINNLRLYRYDAVKMVKSIRRSMRRGKVTPGGELAPERPFNNRKRTAGREEQLLRERIYEQVRARYSA